LNFLNNQKTDYQFEVSVLKEITFKLNRGNNLPNNQIAKICKFIAIMQ